MSAAADWRVFAECRGVDADVFFPERGESAALALSLCAVCPVRAECLDAHLDEPYGIWGGTNQSQRRRLRRARDRAKRAVEGRRRVVPRKPIEHGTEAGYRAHRRHGEPACKACKAANTAATAAFWERRGGRAVA